jgi:hypothetical protein
VTVDLGRVLFGGTLLPCRQYSECIFSRVSSDRETGAPVVWTWFIERHTQRVVWIDDIYEQERGGTEQEREEDREGIEKDGVESQAVNISGES